MVSDSKSSDADPWGLPLEEPYTADEEESGDGQQRDDAAESVESEAGLFAEPDENEAAAQSDDGGTDPRDETPSSEGTDPQGADTFSDDPTDVQATADDDAMMFGADDPVDLADTNADGAQEGHPTDEPADPDGGLVEAGLEQLGTTEEPERRETEWPEAAAGEAAPEANDDAPVFPRRSGFGLSRMLAAAQSVFGDGEEGAPDEPDVVTEDLPDDLPSWAVPDDEVSPGDAFAGRGGQTESPDDESDDTDVPAEDEGLSAMLAATPEGAGSDQAPQDDSDLLGTADADDEPEPADIVSAITGSNDLDEAPVQDEMRMFDLPGEEDIGSADEEHADDIADALAELGEDIADDELEVVDDELDDAATEISTFEIQDPASDDSTWPLSEEPDGASPFDLTPASPLIEFPDVAAATEAGAEPADEFDSVSDEDGSDESGSYTADVPQPTAEPPDSEALTVDLVEAETSQAEDHADLLGADESIDLSGGIEQADMVEFDFPNDDRDDGSDVPAGIDETQPEQSEDPWGLTDDIPDEAEDAIHVPISSLPVPSIFQELEDLPPTADERAAEVAHVDGPAAEGGAQWGERWEGSVQGWIETDGGETVWRPIISTADTLSSWDIETYLGVVTGDAPIDAGDGVEGLAAARDVALNIAVADAIARGGHAVTSVHFTVHHLGASAVVTASGTAVTLRSAG